MKKFAIAATVLALALVAAPFGTAQDEAKTLTGRAVDITCYTQGKDGEGHNACAVGCLTGGKPAGLVVGEGDSAQLYLVIAGKAGDPKAVLPELVGKTIKVTGKVTEKDGMKIIALDEAAAA